MNKNKLLTLLMGRCWHEWKEIYLTNNHTISSSPTFECRYCGEYFTDNPDFSQPAPRDEFIKWISKEKTEIWRGYISKQFYPGDTTKQGYEILNEVLDLSNFADFLCLPETIERWGWEECKESHGLARCLICRDEHRILVPWARYASEKPVHISDKKEATDDKITDNT
jgi:hypothetical protein